MPITIKSANLKYKDTNGEYVGVNSVSDMTTAEQLAAITEAGTTHLTNINNAGTTKVDAVNNAGSTQLTAVNNAGTTQTTAVNTAGATQIANIQTKGQETLASIPGEYSELAGDVNSLKRAINDLDGGTTGQVLRKKSNTDMDVEWANVAQPTDMQVATAVDDYLDNHPEATTTVQDGSITLPKLNVSSLSYVYPEQFGAIGDGTTDDSDAIQEAIDYCIANGKSLRFMRKTYGVMPKQTQNIALKYNSAKYALIVHGELHIDMNEAIIQLLENDEAKVVTLIVIDAKGGSIRNGTFIGDRLTYTNTGAQWDSSKCLELYEVSDYTIENVIMKDSKGDCLSIGGVQKGQQNVYIEYVDYEMNILVKNCTMINGKRGCFTADKYRGVTFENCLFDETSDIGFAFAIDFEPYYGLGNGFDCTFINCTTKGENAGVNVQLVTGTKFIGCNLQSIMGRQTDGIEVLNCNVGELLFKSAGAFVNGCVIGENAGNVAIAFEPTTASLAISPPFVEIFNSKIIGTIGSRSGSNYQHDHLIIKGCNVYAENCPGSTVAISIAHTSKQYKNGIVISDNIVKIVKNSSKQVAGTGIIKVNYEDATIKNNQFSYDIQWANGAAAVGSFSYAGQLKIIGNTVTFERAQEGNYTNLWAELFEFNYPVITPIAFIGNKINADNKTMNTNNSVPVYAFKDKGDKDGSVYVIATDNYIYGINAVTPNDTEAVSFTAKINNIINNEEPNPSATGVIF